MKTCATCQTEQPEENFYLHKNRGGGRYKNCKTCHKAKTTEWHKANPHCKPEQQWRRRGVVGMTWELYQQMLIDQESVCAICQKPDAAGRGLAVDHNHETGEPRGLLCLSYNQLIGKLENGIVPYTRLIAHLTNRTTIKEI